MAVTNVDTAVALHLRRLGQRLTSGRQVLLQVLLDAPGPLTIPMILATRPQLAQSSVYRNLAVMQHAGVVRRIDSIGDHGWYELTERVRGTHHHHLICTSCGSVTDIELPPSLERKLDTSLGQVAEQAEFELADHRLDLLGTCATCRSTLPARR